MFNEIVDIKDGCFYPKKESAYRLDLDDFEFMIYPAHTGWSVLQTKGCKDISFHVEKSYETNIWKFRYGTINSVVNEIMDTLKNYKYDLEDLYEDFE